MLKLYTASLSANGRKVVALARHLGLAVDVEEVNVYRGEGLRPSYRAVNPFGKVPTLVDGGFVLWESNAILVYLSEAHGDFRSWSRDPKRRAELARWLFWESAHFQPVHAKVLGPYAGRIMAPQYVPEPESELDWSAPELVPLLTHLEGQLEQHAYLGGSEVTIADFSVAGMTIFYRRLGFPFDRYPSLARWYERVHALEGWKATSAEPWVT